jgi:hypothetical protein
LSIDTNFNPKITTDQMPAKRWRSSPSRYGRLNGSCAI